MTAIEPGLEVGRRAARPESGEVSTATGQKHDPTEGKPGRGRTATLLDQKLMAFAFLLIAVLLSASGELLLKHGMSQVGVFTFELPMLVRIFLMPQIVLGFALVFGGAIFWLAVISRVDLSFAYPMLALGYIIVVFASWLFFQEPLNAAKLVGVAVICSGVVILARS